MHGGDAGDFAGCAGGTQALIEGANDGVVLAGDDGGHVEGGANGRAAAPGGARPRAGATIAIERGDADQGRELAMREVAEFRARGRAVGWRWWGRPPGRTGGAGRGRARPGWLRSACGGVGRCWRFAWSTSGYASGDWCGGRGARSRGDAARRCAFRPAGPGAPPGPGGPLRPRWGGHAGGAAPGAAHSASTAASSWSVLAR